MTKPHPAQLALTGLLMLLSGLPLASRAGEPLIVVEDRGGTSALPYYEALNLQPRANAPAKPGQTGRNRPLSLRIHRKAERRTISGASDSRCAIRASVFLQPSATKFLARSNSSMGPAPADTKEPGSVWPFASA